MDAEETPGALRKRKHSDTSESTDAGGEVIVASATIHGPPPLPLPREEEKREPCGGRPRMRARANRFLPLARTTVLVVEGLEVAGNGIERRSGTMPGTIRPIMPSNPGRGMATGVRGSEAATSTNLRILQVNLGRGLAAQDLLKQAIAAGRVDLVIASEPYARGGMGCATFASGDGTAMVAVPRGGPEVRRVGAGGGYVAVETRGVLVVSVYSSPNTGAGDLERILDAVGTLIRRRLAVGPRMVLVAGDTNAWTRRCGSTRTNARGEVLDEFMDVQGLVSCRRGDAPSFVRLDGSGGSAIDVTLTTARHADRVVGWRVSSEETMSDHRYIVFGVRESASPRSRQCVPEPSTVWAWRKVVREDFAEAFGVVDRHDLEQVAACEERTTHASAKDLTTELAGRIECACEVSMPRAGVGRAGRGRPVHWWSPAIASLRRDCRAAFRRIARCRRRRPRPDASRAGGVGPLLPTDEAYDDTLGGLVADYRSARRALRNAIRNAKRQCWRELIARVEADPWGLPYKIVMGKLAGAGGGGAVPPRDSGTLLAIAEELFPDDPEERAGGGGDSRARVFEDRGTEDEDGEDGGDDGDGGGGDTVAGGAGGGGVGSVPRVTLRELDAVVRGCPSGRAPGPDGVPYEVVKLAYSCDPHAFRIAYDRCLSRGHFPERWRRARLALIAKPGAERERVELGEPRAFRPLSMLDCAGKILEKLVAERLLAALDRRGGLSPRQYGFRRGRSTAHAVRSVENATLLKDAEGESTVVVSLDVRNAFNSVRWKDVRGALRSWDLPPALMRILEGFLSERTLLVSTADRGVVERPVARGCRRARCWDRSSGSYL
jgi:Reverse transcriptase (RNA-dependent DNA polymerase).